MKNEQLQTSLPPELAEWVKKQALEKYCSVSNVIRQLIAKAKKKSENPPSP